MTGTWVLPPIVVLDRVGSTNAELLQRGREGAPHGAAIRAQMQTAGRGRRAHRWTSPEGGLYLSVLIRPHVASAQLPGLPVACALGVVSTLQAAGCSRARLKWPNDVVVGHAKLAGILTELSHDGSGPFAVCGVGVNMQDPDEGACLDGALRPASFTGSLDEGVAMPSLQELAGQVRAGIVDEAERWEHGLIGAGEGVAPLTGIVDAYNACLAFRGKRVSVHAIDGPAAGFGVLLGVDEWGYALVEDDMGQVLRLDASQASIRPA